MVLRRFKLRARLFAILVLAFAFIAGIVTFYYFGMKQIERFAAEEAGTAVMDGMREKVLVATHSMAVALGAVVSDVDGESAKREILIRAVV